MEPAEETYTKAFVKEFGLIDPDQDWNMATRGSVTVTTSSATEVKVYGKTDDENKYRLMGDFANVSGTQTIEFDIPKGTTDIMAEANGKAVFTTLGGSADFSGTRAASRTVTLPESTSGITVTVSDDYKDISADVVESYTSVVPEDEHNLDIVTQNFSFVSTGNAFTIYPLYWQTGSYSYMGVYWYDTDGNIHEQDIYYNKRGDELLVNTETESSETEYRPTGYDANLKVGSFVKLYSWKDALYEISRVEEVEYTPAENETLSVGSSVTVNYSNTYFISRIDEENSKYYYNKYYCTKGWTPASGNQSSSSTQDIKSKGISLTLPKGTIYGLYIKVFEKGQYGDDDNKDVDGNYRDDWYVFKRYSEAKMNKDIAGKYTYTDNSVDGHVGLTNYDGTRNRASDYYAVNLEHRNDAEKGSEAYVFASYFEIEKDDVKRYFVGFEDWSVVQTDLNDVIFMFDEGQPAPTVVDEDATSYILAAEDLGNTDDFDFNDMVIKVTTPVVNSASTSDDNKYKIEVTALAAGGTLPLKLKRGSTVIESPIEGCTDAEQFHSWFGNGNVSTGTMINTNSATTYATSTKTIYMSETDATAFSMSSYSTDVTNWMGGFSFVVDRTGDGSFTETTEITAPQDGTAPQMMCLPDTWKWPKERVNISTAYPDFGEWGANYTNATWISNCAGNVVE